MPESVPPQDDPTRRRVMPGWVVLLIFPLLGIAAAILVAALMRPADEFDPASANSVASPVRVLEWGVPDFELTDLDGETVALSDYRGRVVFLNFWATWCRPCVEEMPAFYAFSQQQGDDGAVVLTVNKEESVETIRDFFQANAIGLVPVLLDSDGALGRRYSVGLMPTTYIIDPQGTARYVKYGALTVEDMQDFLEKVEG